MKTSAKRVKKHKKSHLKAVHRPRKTKGKTRMGAHSGHVFHKRRKSNSHLTGIVTAIASTVVGVGLASVIVARGGVDTVIDTVKKTWASLF